VAQRLKFFVEQWAWFVVRQQLRLIRKFRIIPSLLNEMGIFRFEFESKLRKSLHGISSETVALYWMWSLLKILGSNWSLATPLVMFYGNDSVVAVSSNVSAASDVHGAVVLVQYYVLRTELSCWRAVSCVVAFTDRRRLHRSIEQWQVLSGTALQHQPHATGGDDPQACRWEPLMCGLPYHILMYKATSCWSFIQARLLCYYKNSYYTQLKTYYVFSCV